MAVTLKEQTEDHIVLLGQGRGVQDKTYSIPISAIESGKTTVAAEIKTAMADIENRRRMREAAAAELEANGLT